MSIRFHGTTKENAETILKNGFRPRTYFAQHLEDSLVMGGNYIFWVWLPEAEKGWEYISNKRILPNRILTLRKFNVQKIYFSDKVNRLVKRQFFKEQHGKFKFCTKCDGRGQLEKRDLLERGTKKKLTACPKCQGFGCLRPDGKRFNEN